MKQGRCAIMAALAALLLPGSLHGQEQGAGLEVTTAAITRTTLHEFVQAYGTVDAAPGQLTAVSLPYAGQVVKLAVTAGRRVKRNDVLLDFKPDPAVSLAFKQAQTALTLAQGELERARRLMQQHLATNSQLATAQKALTDAQAAVTAQQEAGGGQVVVTIRAPFDGTVTEVVPSQGDRVAASTTILDIASTNGISVSLFIEPAVSRLIEPGQIVNLSVLEEPLTLTAAIDNIGGAIEPKSGLVVATLRITHDSPVPVLAGEHVRAAIAVADKVGWAVPRASVLTADGGSYVFQVLDGKAKRVEVTTGLESNDLVQINEPFDPKQPVIVEGSYEASDGVAVQVSKDNSGTPEDDR